MGTWVHIDITNSKSIPNTSESVKRNFWDCIQARGAWRWATFIMHELCEVQSGNYDCFNWKQALLGERIPKKYSKTIKIWHLLRGITMWTIWIERNDKVFNQTQWHEARVKQRIWNELIIYSKMAWKRVNELIKINNFWRWRCFVVLIGRGVLVTFCVGGTI